MIIVYIGLSSTNTYKLEYILNAAAHLIGALQSLTISPILSVTPFTGSPSASASNSRSVPSCEAVLLGLLLTILGPFVPQYLLCTVVPPFGPRLVVTWLSRGCVILRPSLGVSLLSIPIAGTGYLSPSGLTFFLFLLTSSASA